MLGIAAIILKSLVPFLLFGATVVFGIGISAGIYFSLPLRQRERARLFIELIESGIKAGHTPEHTIVSLASTRDRTFGVRFHLLAAHIKSGLRLGDALARTPKFLPRQIVGLLRAGEKAGNLPDMFNVCRATLADARSQTVGGLNIFSPSIYIGPVILSAIAGVLSIFVLPKMRYLIEELGSTVPSYFDLLHFGWFVNSPLILTVTLVFIFFFLFGTWLPAPMEDWLDYRFPWRKTRMRRQFCSVLGLLLDAHVHEAAALQLASESTGNRRFIRQVEGVIEDLKHGIKLSDALARIDDGSQFQWRLNNAAYEHAGFSRSLNGWIETLDAKAFQQEQSALQIFTSAVVVLNGIAVCLMTVGLFSLLISFLNTALLW